MREHTGPALGIAAIALFGYTAWAAVLAIVLWLSLTIYAIVKWIGAPEDHASALTVFLLVIVNVTMFVLLLTVAMYAAGKSMRYRKRDRGDDRPLATTD
jgi:hypothetical protein